MATTKDLVKWILRIEGVTAYILVRDDGHIISHNFEDGDTVASIVTYTGLNCRAIKSAIGVMYFKMAGYTRKNDEKLLIFPLGKYFIGISQDSEAYTPDITARVEKILRAVTGKTQDTEKTAP